jgi:hypothetical protein
MEEKNKIYERDHEEWVEDEKLRAHLLLSQPIPRPSILPMFDSPVDHGITSIVNSANRFLEGQIINWFRASEERYQAWIRSTLPPPPEPPAAPATIEFRTPTLELFETALRTRSLVMVTLDSARNLEPSDDNGLADPYVVLQLKKKYATLADTTAVSWRRVSTLDPTWRCQLALEVPVSSSKNDYTLEGTVWDYDNGIDDDYMGAFTIDLNTTVDSVGGLQWIPLIDRRINPNAAAAATPRDLGDIQVAVSVVSNATRQTYLASEQKKQEEFKLFMQHVDYDHITRLADLVAFHAYEVREYKEHLLGYQKQVAAQQALLANASAWQPNQ